MDRKIGQNPEILESIKKNIALAEEKRKQVRFAYNLKDFEQGNIQILKNKEFALGLEAVLVDSSPENREKQDQLLTYLGEAALADELSVRERALALLSTITLFHLEQNDRDFLLILAKNLCSWLEFENEMVPGFTVLNQRLESVLLWFIKNKCWLEAEEIVVLLHRIQTGNLKKKTAIKSLTGKTLQNLPKKVVLESLTDEYLLDNNHQQLIQNILHSIGHKAVIYLLNRVIQSHSRPERLLLLGLIPTFGSIAIPALEECLESKPPWAVIRNIIFIVSEMDMDTHFGLIEQYFGYPDERVQHEMVSCVLKLGGEHLKSRLLAGLRLVNDRMKIVIIRLLIDQADNDENIVTALLELAVKNAVFSSNSRHDLLLAIIAALKTFPSKKGVEQLKIMQAVYAGKPGVEQLLLQIDGALKVIEPKLRHSLQHVENFQDLVSFDNDPVQQQLAFEKVRETEEDVKIFLRKGEIKKAGQLIVDQAMAAAKIKDFYVAELLKDRLLEIDSMAFSEVIQLGDYIDEQKSSSITSHHLEIWSELYEEMTTEEFNKLYYSLQQENYRQGEIVVKSGETDNSLYFLNSGYMSLSCDVGGKEVFLKRLQPSYVLGGEQFFSPSVWTVTLKALSEVQLHVLDRQVFKKITEEYPAIEGKLHNYCQKHVQVPELLKMSGEDRRENPRYPLAISIQYSLLDPFGNKGKKRFTGKIIDISLQGLAFAIRISNMSNARLLLGRHILATIIYDDELLPQYHGVIVGVRLQDPILLDFSVHVKLSQKIDNDLFKKLLSCER